MKLVNKKITHSADTKTFTGYLIGNIYNDNQYIILGMEYDWLKLVYVRVIGQVVSL